jgi:hypothetical protein
LPRLKPTRRAFAEHLWPVRHTVDRSIIAGPRIRLRGPVRFKLAHREGRGLALLLAAAILVFSILPSGG